MDITFLTNDSVALCGDVDRDELLTCFSSLRIVPWSPTIKCLVTDGVVADRWKLREASKLGIPIRTWVPPKAKQVPSELWVDKFAPKRAHDIIGNDAGCKEIFDWLKRWSSGPPKGKRAILISGPPGIGKTTSAHLLVKHLKYEVIEMNASCVRNASSVRETFSEAMQSRCVGSPRVLIMDEVDGMSSGDRGGVAALANLLKTCTFPVICIANERGAPRLRPLNAVCEEVKFSRPQKGTIAKALMESVVKSESLKITKAELEELCERNGNDIRQILNYLQIQCGSAKDETLRLDAWSATGRLFGGRGTLNDRTELAFVDHSMIPLMVQEGYAAAAGKSRGSDADRLERCVKAADLIGVYDIMDHRIHRTQAWGLLPGALTCIVGAATATAGPAPFQLFPSVLGKMSKRSKHRRMYSELALATGESSTNLYDSIGMYRSRLYGLKNSDAIIEDLQTLRLDRDTMFETLPSTVFTGDEASVAMDTKLKSEVTRKWKKIASEKPMRVVEEDEMADYDSESESEMYA